jgi:putative hydrolases of HD superfamily
MIASNIGHEEIGEEIISLWMDYEETSSPEAELAHELDKLEMIIQANEYEKMYSDKVLDCFFESTKDSFRHPEVSLSINNIHLFYCFIPWTCITE